MRPRIPCSAAELERLRAALFAHGARAQRLERHGNALGAALVWEYACDLVRFMVGLQDRLWQWRRSAPRFKVSYWPRRWVLRRRPASPRRGASRHRGSGRRPVPRRPRGPITG